MRTADVSAVDLVIWIAGTNYGRPHPIANPYQIDSIDLFQDSHSNKNRLPNLRIIFGIIMNHVLVSFPTADLWFYLQCPTFWSQSWRSITIHATESWIHQHQTTMGIGLGTGHDLLKARKFARFHFELCAKGCSFHVDFSWSCFSVLI